MKVTQLLERTTIESDRVHIAISWLPGYQLSSEHIDLSINGCDCVRRALQSITFRHFLPACSQSASHVWNPTSVYRNMEWRLLGDFVAMSIALWRKKDRG